MCAQPCAHRRYGGKATQSVMDGDGRSGGRIMCMCFRCHPRYIAGKGDMSDPSSTASRQLFPSHHASFNKGQLYQCTPVAVSTHYEMHAHRHADTIRHADCTCTFIHTYINTYVHTHIHIHTHSYIHTYMHTYVRTCTHTVL